MEGAAVRGRTEGRVLGTAGDGVVLGEHDVLGAIEGISMADERWGWDVQVVGHGALWCNSMEEEERR